MTKLAICDLCKFIDNKIIARIYGNQRGWSFSKNHFLDLGGDDAVRKVFSLLEGKGTIRRVAEAVAK